MSSPAPPRRRWLQFSLRGLLLGMLFVGATIAIYRWPWQDERWETPFQTGLADSQLGFSDSNIEFDEGQWKTNFGWPVGYLPSMPSPFPESPPELKRTTTFRRSWLFKPVKDGPETIVGQAGILLGSRWYEAGDLRRVTLFHLDGTVLRLESYRQGKAHGPFEFSEAVRSLRGEYLRGKREGVWEYQYVVGDERIAVQQSYANDLPHGEWTWRSATGVSASAGILQSATFDQGVLTHWNGHPWREALETWLKDSGLDPQTQDLFTQTKYPLDFVSQSVHEKDHFSTFTAADLTPIHSFLVYSPQRRDGEGISFFNLKELGKAIPLPALEAMFASALVRSRLLVVRFGVVAFVPVCEREVHWQDGTGVSQVRFAPNSPQQAAWEERVSNTIPQGFDSDWWFQLLFAETPIQIDGREFNPGPEYGRVFTLATNPATGELDTVLFDQSSPRHSPTHPRSRRNTLGLLLESRGYSCEQRGNVLVMWPSP